MAKKQTSGNLALEQQRVIVIPAHDEIVARKLRVAAYARVSSSSEDQLNSYRVQNQYYSEFISGNPDWEMVDIYADEGITGTSVEKREDFQRMMQDCRKGKIDLILVKSISRFARNTKDCLAAVRELKELGVSVLFEEQGIDTARVSSEMVTAIMASLAQKGSESISGNVRWGIQKRMQDGTYVASSAPYGYRLVNLQLEIQPEEAEIVRWIFKRYLEGTNIQEIARELNERHSEQPHKWYKTTISYILSNERYIGDCLWQKCYMTDTIPAKQMEFLEKLPQGIHSMAGDAGKMLSGGQRQRISLARAILKDAPIVVLDEATAYADPENEEKMEAAIAELVKGKTLVVIAHKLPAIMNADQICVMDHGKLVATGKHQELIQSCLEYQKLWKAAQDSAEWKVHTAKEGK